MAKQFNADEVFEIAQQIERNGVKFYSRSAEVASDPKAKELLRQLADMEKRHEVTFGNLREQVLEKNPDWAVRFFDEESRSQAALYLRATAEGLVFDLRSDPAALLDEEQPMETIYQKAIGLEKDSIAYYQGVKEAVREGLGRDQVDAILREEMRHVVMLTDQLRQLNA
jgi:rubrerythrin